MSQELIEVSGSSIHIINSFIKLVEEKNSVFSLENWQALPEINDELAKLEKETNVSSISRIIKNWTKKYPNIKPALEKEFNIASQERVDYENSPEEDSRNLDLQNQFLTPDECLEIKQKLHRTIENTKNTSPQKS